MRADLALIGYGHVGRRFADLILERGERLSREHELECRVIGIATRRHGALFDATGLDTRAATARLAATGSLGEPSGAASEFPATPSSIIGGLANSDALLRVMIETTTLAIADGQPAIAHVEAAIAAGCHVVTANKGPVAFAYDRLQAGARAAEVSFLFEGAVMDGIPIFNLARETLPAVTVHGFRGIVNSTTTHILSAVESGMAFAPALERMQAEGIAEADPVLDVDGWDAAAKAAALANVLMGAAMTPHEVDRTGIGPESVAAARQARARGLRLRLVASAARGPDGSVRAVVRPEALPADDPLAGAGSTAKMLILHTDLLGDLAIQQLGGGLTMTAYALLTDLVTIRKRCR